MHLSALLERWRQTGPVGRQASFAAAALGAGFLLLPLLIFFTGSLILGRYEGASLWGTYATVFVGLMHGSIASWVVVLGPYLLLLLQKGLRAWWRAGTNPG
jgi:hypothetical protein